MKSATMKSQARKFEKQLSKVKKECSIVIHTESDKQLLTYIQQSFSFFASPKSLPKDWVYAGQYDFILKHGRFFMSQPLTDAEREIVNEALKNIGFKPRMKECFYNAQLLAMNDKTGQIKYCEGFGMSIIPCNHGWAMINDKVIDITWKDDEGKNYFGDFDKSYFGFSLPTERVTQKMFKTGWAVSWLDDWKGGWELLTKPFTQE